MARTTTNQWVSRVVVALALAVVAAVVLRVGDSRSEQISVRDPTAWLYQRDTGELVQANATTGEIQTRVRVASPNDDVVVAQARSGAVVLDRTKGDVVFVDGVTLKVGTRTPIPGVDAESRVLVSGDRVRVVTSTVAQSISVANGSFGTTTKLDRALGAAVLLGNGVLYGATGGGVVAISETATGVERQYAVSALGVSGRGAFAIDGAAGVAYGVNSDGSRGSKRCLGATMQTPVPSRAADTPYLAVLDSSSGVVSIADTLSNTCRTQALDPQAGRLNEPVVVDNRVYVPLASSGEVAVLRAGDATVASRFGVDVPAGRPFDLFAKDGLVWMNDPRGGAAVINEAGFVQRFDKTRGGSGGVGVGGARPGPSDKPGTGSGSGTGVVGTGAGSGENGSGDSGSGAGPNRAGGNGGSPANLPPSSLVADFEFSTSVANVDQVVSFTDRSLGGPTAWTWDFGDGTFESGPRASHAWKTAGTYRVTLRVDNATQTSRASATIRVVAKDVKERPKADFSVSSQRVEVGANVTFTSTSKGNPSETRWNFGDSTTASGSPVTKSWSAAGIYTVTLTVANTEGSDTKTGQITVFDRVDPPVAIIAADLRETLVGQSVAFVSQSRGNPTDLRWNFGDNTPIATGTAVRHAWAAPGQYTVTLSVANTAGSNAASVVITVKEPVLIPVARINASALTAVENEPIRFTSLSINKPDTLAWDFGDGTTAGVSPVSKSWPKAGVYNVTLTATNTAGSNSQAVTVTITPNLPPPVAAFDFAPATPEVNVPVVLTDRSVGAAEWLWDFGDGTTSTLQNPTKVFNRTGAFQVRLTVTNRAGTNSLVRTVTVRMPLPVSSFTFAPSAPQAGVDVQFTDTSTGNPTAWLWSFGDGGTANVKNPIHKFAAAGAAPYTVTLTVTNETGSATSTRQIAVSPPPPVAAFTFAPAAPVVNTEVTFTNASTGGAGTTFAWDFGDGTSSAAASPKKTYTVPGSYNVRFTVTNTSGTSTAARIVTVGVAPPVAAIAGPPTGTAGVPVTFTNASTGGPATAVTWDFGDGSPISNALNPPPHAYAARVAPYTVTLTMTNASGTSTAVHQIAISGLPPVVTSIVINSQVPPYVAGQTLGFAAAVTGGALPYASYTWTFEGGAPATAVSAGPEAVSVFTTAGVHRVTVVVRDAGGQLSAPFTGSFTIVLPPPPTVTAAPAAVTLPTTGPRTQTFTATPAGGLPPTQITWTLPAGAVLAAGTVNSPTITVVFPANATTVPVVHLLRVVNSEIGPPPGRVSAAFTVTVTITPAVTPPSTLALPPDGLVLAALAWLKRRRRPITRR